MTKNNSNPGEKMFTLKGTELNLIGNITRRRDQAMLDIFSYIALERLNYPVTQQTQFRTDEQGNLYITELEEEKDNTAKPEVETA